MADEYGNGHIGNTGIGDYDIAYFGTDASDWSFGRVVGQCFSSNDTNSRSNTCFCTEDRSGAFVHRYFRAVDDFFAGALYGGIIYESQ